ncbi:lipid scramblase CLPTM1L-like isoform X2 [Gordionus sp. m RMFG-2023]
MPPPLGTFNLLKSKKTNSTPTSDPLSKDELINYVLTQLTIHVVNDASPLKTTRIPLEIAKFIRLNSKREYLPIACMSDVDGLIKRYKPISDIIDPVNASVATTSIDIKPTSFGKLRLFTTIERSADSMKNLGFTDKDTDEINSLFVDTNIFLLLLTFVIAFFHLLFDTLAFKNDINFWRHRNSMTGISTRTVVWRCFSQIVIFLYLCNEKTSLIILIPTGVGSLIEIWKLLKAFKFRISWDKEYYRLRIEKMASMSGEKLTQQYDQEAMQYLSYLMYPLVTCGAIYSLLYVPHKSWYSWLINSMVNGVYAFGFIFMLPQLIINYKLKSVSHLPWKAFMYKAFNTFIDDLFAFIITMPTTHRIACFRDDLIFLCYLYQRWLYPVDKKRMDEASITFMDDTEPDLKMTENRKKNQ